jgi:hypothetical protein
MSNVQTSAFTVLAARYRKANDGKVVAYLQVQSHPSAPVGFVRVNSMHPPLAGTRIRATGKIVETAQGPVMQVHSENDIVALTGQQGQIFYKAVKTLLDRFGISYDEKKLEAATQNTNVHLCQMDAARLSSVLATAGIANADELVQERKEAFAAALTKNFLNGLESIRLPFDVDAKREVPFEKATWPMDIMAGCLPNPVEATQGQKGHPHMPNNRPFYLVDNVKYDGIDNFFRAVAIASDQDGLFPSWIRDTLRPSTLTQCFLDEKQKQGTQIFTGDDMKQLERLGLNAPAKIAARLGNMIQLPAGEKEIRMIPLGVYQSSTLIATLDKLEKNKNPLNATLDDVGLDPFQKKALISFCEGSPLTLISGPPGTGKSTLISRMIAHAQQDKERVVVLTPTGKVSSRLNESFEKIFPKENRPVSVTAHAMFYGSVAARKANRGAPTLNTTSLREALDSEATESFPVNVERVMRFASYKEGKNEVAKPEGFFYQDLAPAELLRGATVFVDESTQITGDMAALILEMKPKRLVMTGDLSQLKPVGAGKPFHDLIHLAKSNIFGEQVNFMELKIDHRATKELADFTRKLRQGSIPLDYVETYTGDASATATALLTREAAVIECKKLDGVIDIVEQIVTRALIDQKATFAIVENEGSVLAGSTALVLKEPHSPALFAQHLVAPSVMTMAYTNIEVSQLNQTVANVLRPLNVTGKGMAEVPSLSVVAANGIQLGDIVLQTENAKACMLYTTPQGNYRSDSTMNGEAFAFIGAHTWLPLPSASATIQALWVASGALNEVSNLVTSGQHADPHAHFELLQTLQTQVHKKNPAALTLVQMGLSELLFVPQTKLTPGINVILEAADVKRMVLPPSPPAKDSADFEDIQSLLRNVWKMDIAHIHSAPGRTGLVEMPEYKAHYEKMMHGIETLVLGNSYTVHKAQGSQAKIAISVVSPPMRPDEATNHEASVYTATTRAEQSGFILMHGIKAVDLNDSWKRTREFEATRLSPVVLIAQGDIPAVGSAMTLVTAVPPQHRFESLPTDDAKWDDHVAIGFRSKVAMASQGLPATLRLDKSPAYMREKMAGMTGNSAVVAAGMPSIPDMLGMVTSPIAPQPTMKSTFVWDQNAHPSKALGLKLQSDTKEVGALLGDILDGFSF